MAISRTTFDPARDASSLLGRLGFIALLGGMPIASLVSRTGAPVVAALGIVLLFVAQATDRDRVRPPVRLTDALMRAPVLAGIVMLAWALISLLWTPAPYPAGLRLMGVIVVAAMTLVGVLAMPARMRSANLYPLSIGVALGAVATVVVAFLAAAVDDEGGRRSERALTVVVMCAWPAIGWLRSRDREREAWLLAVLVAFATAVATPSLAPVVAFAIGALAFLLGQAFGRRGAAGVGLALALLLAVAPFALLWIFPWVEGALPRTEWVIDMDSWRQAIAHDPARLLTGHGSGSLRRGVDGPFSLQVVGVPAVALWWELGLVGAVASAVVVWGATTAGAGARRPAVTAAVASGWALTLSGIDRGESWWPLVLAMVTLAFVAIDRGQFRSRRPRAFAPRVAA